MCQAYVPVCVGNFKNNNMLKNRRCRHAGKRVTNNITFPNVTYVKCTCVGVLKYMHNIRRLCNAHKQYELVDVSNVHLYML